MANASSSDTIGRRPARHKEDHRFAVGVGLGDKAARVDKGKVAVSNLDRRTDAELMRLLQAGHREPFEVVYRRHGGVALALACRIVGDFALAEEVVQDAFVTLWRQSVRYEPERGTMRSWVLGIVHHRAIDALRRKVRAERSQSAAAADFNHREPGHDFTAFEVARREQARTTWGELEALPAEQQEVIKLAFLGELTSSEIAQTLELPLGTVKGRMRLGLQKLRRSLEAPGGLEQVAA